VHLRAVDRDHADLREPPLRAQRHKLAEHPRDRVQVTFDEPRDRRVIRALLRGARRASGGRVSPKLPRQWG
jgi:hypothetical protein